MEEGRHESINVVPTTESQGQMKAVIFLTLVGFWLFLVLWSPVPLHNYVD